MSAVHECEALAFGVEGRPRQMHARFRGKLWRVLAAPCCSTVTAGYKERLLDPKGGGVCPVHQQRGDPGLSDVHGTPISRERGACVVQLHVHQFSASLAATCFP